jgi:hypothetical protein
MLGICCQLEKKMYIFALSRFSLPFKVFSLKGGFILVSHAFFSLARYFSYYFSAHEYETLQGKNVEKWLIVLLHYSNDKTGLEQIDKSAAELNKMSN